jgi:acetyl-CoA carboxylase biotin carboxyl carrier protein
MSDQNNPIDQTLIRNLAVLLGETDLTEIEVEQGGLRIRVARQITVNSVISAAPSVVSSVPSQPVVASSSVSNVTDFRTHTGAVKSPMVGTIYLAPDPTSAPFISVGDSVKEGQTLLIVEAMKVMNNIPAPRSGKVTHILVQDKEPTEYGQPLVIIE